MEAHFARETQADQARREKACLDVVDKALTAYRDGLAAAGATIETAVGAAMVASDFTAAEADHHRNVLIDLARILAEPGERVLGVGLMSCFLPAEVVVVLTHGFAVKTGSGTFRIDHDRETPSTTTEFGVHGLTLTTHLSLGDLHYYDAALLRPGGGRLPRLYLALRTQELTQTKQSKARFQYATVRAPHADRVSPVNLKAVICIPCSAGGGTYCSATTSSESLERVYASS